MTLRPMAFKPYKKCAIFAPAFLLFHLTFALRTRTQICCDSLVQHISLLPFTFYFFVSHTGYARMNSAAIRESLIFMVEIPEKALSRGKMA
jgi:hypothetical protein